MATLVELGRNSASITYGPVATGAEMWPTFALFDQWIRNDKLQGTATAASTTVTGVGSVFTVQVRAGDVIKVANQMRTVASVTSDTAFEVTVAFSPAITLASTITVINTTLSGTVTTAVRGSTSGVVSVTNGSANITGVGTYFLSDFTNSVSTSAVAGTIAIDTSGNITGVGTSFNTGADGSANRLQPGDSIFVNSTSYFVIATVSSDTVATVVTPPGSAVTSGATIAKAANGTSGRTVNINGRIRQITAITSNTAMTVNSALDFTDSNLKVKAFPRGTLAVTAGSAAVAGTNTNFTWDLVSGDQVWLGDELRTFTFSANATTVAALTDYTGYSGTAINVLRQAVTGITFWREDSYITGSSTAFTTELRVGDDITIDGTECTVTAILSATQFKINHHFTHNTTGATVYKKKKIHGYVLEGTREGAATAGKFTTATTSVVAAGTIYAAGNTTVTVATATSFVQYGLIKVSGAGGPPVLISGTATAATNTVTGTNTSFTTQLHVGAELVIAGQYLTVTAIASDTSLTVSQTVTVAAASPIYRSIPLYTYIAAVSGAIMTLGHPIRNTVYSTGANPPTITTATAATDYLEYVYSAPNKSAEATTTLFNTSLDRKYFAFRFLPLATGGGSGNAITTAGSAYNLIVYERWTAGAAQTHGVGINKADLSDSASAQSGVTDLTSMTQTTGGFLYLFAKPRYVMLQGKTFSNAQTQWLGCIEFERAQPEDTGTGLGTSTGVSIYTGNPVTGTPAVSPWPCFAYFNGNRFPVGSGQTPTLPIAHTNVVHGGVFAVPRIRLSTGDLTGANAHIYSACTITTGRWGHLWEVGADGAYNSAGTITAGSIATGANRVPQPHMGHIVPVYTNVYNSKRFMFSPVVVLGTAYDPDIRGRIYGLKVIPSALGTLMDTVSVTTDSNDFYDSTQSATDHWVVTAAVQTYTIQQATTTAFQSIRSLEVTPAVSANTNTAFTNAFRWAIPS